MNIIEIIGILIFSVGYAFITLEHKTKINKSAFALLTGGLLWIIVALAGYEGIEETLIETGSEILGLVVFLFTSMALIEILIDYNFFDYVRYKLFSLNFDERKQFLMIMAITFALSAVINNLTVVIVMGTIATRFFRKENILPVMVGIVIAANSGGAFFPIGDVTTMMMWFEGKFTALEIIKYGFLPSLVTALVPIIFLWRKIKPGFYEVQYDILTKLSFHTKIIIALVFASFGLSLVINMIGLPPYLGLILGLSIVWIAVEYFNTHEEELKTRVEEEISAAFKRTDIISRLFFIGVLLAVSALNVMGVLEDISRVIYGEPQTFNSIVFGNVILGIISSILDNVPLTAIAMEILTTKDSLLWVLLSITVGTGGSLFVVGSAAGVVAMGMVKELTFFRYFKLAFAPALLGYLAGVGVWYLQYILIG